MAAPSRERTRHQRVREHRPRRHHRRAPTAAQRPGLTHTKRHSNRRAIHTLPRHPLRRHTQSTQLRHHLTAHPSALAVRAPATTRRTHHQHPLHPNAPDELRRVRPQLPGGDINTAPPSRPANGAATTASVHRCPDTTTSHPSRPPASAATASAATNDVAYRSPPANRTTDTSAPLDTAPTGSIVLASDNVTSVAATVLTTIRVTVTGRKPLNMPTLQP